MSMDYPDNLSKFGNGFQTKCIVALLTDRGFLDQTFDVISPQFFESEANQWTVERILAYFAQYRAIPTADALKNEWRKIPESHDVLRSSVKDNLRHLYQNLKQEDISYIKDELLAFCKNQAVKSAILKSVDLLSVGKFDQIKQLIDKAMHAGAERNVGHIWETDIEERTSKVSRSVVPTPWKAINDITDGGLGVGELGCIVAASGCHAKDTSLLMADGTSKLVQDVQVGDTLLGPDSMPRTVLRLIRGRDTMYKITPIKGKPFIVNGDHVLSLRHSRRNTIVNLTVREYLQTSSNFKNVYKLYRTGQIDFNRSVSKLTIDPYVLGVLLGDGCLKSKNLSVTTADVEVKDAITAFASSNGCSITTHTKSNNSASAYTMANRKGAVNPIAQNLRNLQLFDTGSGNKFIPDAYKYGSVRTRKHILAGLLDSDGSLTNNCVDYISKSITLASDVVFVARSLGLAAYIAPCVKRATNAQNHIGSEYFRVSISGHTNIIPTRLKRKVAVSRLQCKNVLHTGFSIEKLEVDDFYGFTVTGDQLYVMGDFTVTHNSGKSWVLCAIGAHAMTLGKRVLHYTFELQQNYVGLRYDTYFTGIEPQMIRHHKEQVQESIDSITGKLIIKYFPPRSVSINAISAHIQRLISMGQAPDMIILDYADLMFAAGKSDSRHEELQFIHEEFRGLLGTLGIPGWTASQSQRSSVSSEIIEADKIAGSYGKIMTDDFVMSISRLAADKMSNTGRAYVMKNRLGPDGQTFPAILDLGHGKIELFAEDDPEYQSVKNRMHDGETAVRKLLKTKHDRFVEKRKEGSEPILPNEI